jgi:hypothetical protein
MNYHQEAIKILADPTLDYRALIYKLAVTQPGVLLELTGRDKATLDLMSKCRAIAEGPEDNAKIQAIKYFRDTTKTTLTAAKNGVEAILKGARSTEIAEIIENGKYPPATH